MLRHWCGYLSGVRCRLFAYGPADATASQNAVTSCLIQIQIGFTYQVPAHPDSPGQRAVKRVCVCSAIHNSLLYDSTNGYGQYNANVYGTIITTMAIARLC